MKKRLRKLITWRNHKGMGLMEVIVAIGISTITLTGAVSFSISLMRRSQDRFVEISVLQLQNVIVEQLQLVEANLKRDPKTATPSAFDSSVQKSSFCTVEQDLALSFPLFMTPEAPFKLYLANSVSDDWDKSINRGYRTVLTELPASESPSSYYFVDLQTNERFGAFQNYPVQIAIKKKVQGDIIVFRVVIYYKSINAITALIPDNATNFTKYTEVRMFKDAVCR